MESFTREITAKDAKTTEKKRIRYSSKHIKHLPPGTITDFEWKDYCPLGFRYFDLFSISSLSQRFLNAFTCSGSGSCRRIQQLEDINHDEYMKSICNDETLRKLSQGKVGNMFLLSKDDRFLIKILRKSEIKVLYICLYDILLSRFLPGRLISVSLM